MKSALTLLSVVLAGVFPASSGPAMAGPYLVVMNDWADATASYRLDAETADAVTYTGPAEFSISVSGGGPSDLYGWWSAQAHVLMGPNVWTAPLDGGDATGVFGMDVFADDENGAALAAVSTVWLFRVGDEDVPFALDLGPYGTGSVSRYDLRGRQWQDVFPQGAWDGRLTGTLSAGGWYRLTAVYDQGIIDDQGFAGMSVRGEVIFDEGRAHVPDPQVPAYALPEVSTVTIVLLGAVALLGRRHR